MELIPIILFIVGLGFFMVITNPSPSANFEFDPELTAAINVTTNEALIYPDVLPRVPVTQETFQYLEIPVAERFRIPETLVGPRGKPNQVHFTGTKTPSATQDHALMGDVAGRSQDQATVFFDPRSNAAEGVDELMKLRKELAMADLVFDTTNYDASQIETLVGPGQWSDPTSNPVAKILTTKDKMVMRPNIMTLGQEVETQLLIHPKILGALRGREEASPGAATNGDLARLFGMEQVLVGKAWYDENAGLQDASLTRAWGKKVAMHHRSRRAVTTRNGIQILTWGANFVWPIDGQDFAAMSWIDLEPGATGVEWIKVATRYKHHVIAKLFGWLFVDAVA